MAKNSLIKMRDINILILCYLSFSICAANPADVGIIRSNLYKFYSFLSDMEQRGEQADFFQASVFTLAGITCIGKGDVITCGTIDTIAMQIVSQKIKKRLILAGSLVGFLSCPWQQYFVSIWKALKSTGDYITYQSDIEQN
jgi:hypothetical protein